jgi:cell division protein FtsI (penicillin-binding protein 3)
MRSTEAIRRLSGRGSFVWIKRWVTPEEAERVRALHLEGVDVVTERRRFYPHSDLASAYLGFAGRDEVGLSGIELAFDSALRGSSSALPARRDARGRKLVAGEGASEARRGARLVLALDAQLQYAAERALDRALERTGARRGSITVLDPWSGDVLVVAERPGFDLNRFWLEGTERFRARSLTDPFEPGSTLKPFVLAVALQSGAVRLEERVDCEEGAWRIADRVIHDWKPYGVLSVRDVVVYSSNIGAAKVGARVGPERLVPGLRTFGFGERTGSGFPGESPGVVRALRAKQVVELSTLSYGQGMSATALQLAVAGSMLANGGRRVEPRVALRLERPDGSYQWPSGRGDRAIPEPIAQETLALLREAVERGTGRLASVPGVSVAGKTGTAQKPLGGGYARDLFTASFLGMVPASSPRLVVMVVLDEPREPHTGGAAAAPVFREVATHAASRVWLAAGERG